MCRDPIPNKNGEIPKLDQEYLKTAMSFLAGRLAGVEGSYFLQESKQAVTKILQKQKNSPSVTKNVPDVSSADVLPEVLRHSLPPKIFHGTQESSSTSFTGASKWSLKPDLKMNGSASVSAGALNPLKGYVSLPQVTFGPRRWQLPSSENSVLASTANDLRQDKYTTINPQKLKAAAAGLSHIGAAFAIATSLVFGGAAVIFGLIASKFELHNSDDIRSKGKDMVQSKMDAFREQLVPMKTWAEDMSKKWHFEREESLKEKPLIRELSRKLGAKTSA